MNKAATNRQIMETYYKSINQGDFDTVINLMSEDVIFHMIGTVHFLEDGKEGIEFTVSWCHL